MKITLVLRKLSILVVLLAFYACGGGGSKTPTEPSSVDISPAILSVADPYSFSTYTWRNGNTVSITNGSDETLRYMLAIFRIPNPSASNSLETQELHSLKGVEVPAGQTINIFGDLPQCGAYQADVYTEITPEEVRNGSVEIHPSVPTRRLEVSFNYGHEGECPKPPIPPTPPPTPCPVAKPATATFLGWDSQTKAALKGTVKVINDGLWTVRLLATSSVAEYTSNTPDFVKDGETVTLVCGGTRNLSVQYVWGNHPSEIWWIEVRHNGVFHSKTAYLTNPHN